MFSCGRDEFEAKPGDSFVLKGGIEHSARALEASVVLDVFTPYREDYLPQASALVPTPARASVVP